MMLLYLKYYKPTRSFVGTSLLENRLTAFLDSMADEYGIPGYDCAVYHHHRPIYRHMRGYADIDAKRFITENMFTMTASIGNGGYYQTAGEQFYTETGGSCPILAPPRYLAREPLKFDPGDGYCYGICHEMLAALIEKLTGEPFDRYLFSHIFQSLGMKNIPAGKL